MPTFKAAYLVHGDDHGRIAERRARLRALAESSSGAQGVELFDGDDATPDTVAGALNAMTLALGRRFIIVDGVERWRDKELDSLQASVKAIAPETTIAFFAREDNRTKAPERLHAIVKQADGDIAAEKSVKPWELPKWVVARAHELGIDARPGGRAGADPARRRPPAAAAARAREARARDRRPGTGHDPRRGSDHRVERLVGGAQGVGGRRRAGRRRSSGRDSRLPGAA